MKLSLWWLLTFVATTSLFSTADAKPTTGKQDAGVEHRSNDPLPYEELILPYYGGLRGHLLRLRKQGDGTVNTDIVAPAPSSQARTRDASSLQTSTDNSSLDPTDKYYDDFDKIQLAAARLVAIQETAKRRGAFSDADNKYYAESLLELGQAAQNLANLQRMGQLKDFGALLQAELMMPQKQPWPSVEDEQHIVGESVHDEHKVEEVTEEHVTDQDLLPANPEDPYEDVSDSVAVLAPKKDASVAEAKPVGLSIAGEGGVASSKPNAVAFSGRNGLAVSSPKATALAGVSPEEAAAFSISMPTPNNLVIKASKPVRQRHTDLYDYDYNGLVAPLLPATREAATSGLQKLAAKSAHLLSPADIISRWKVSIHEDATPPVVSSHSRPAIRRSSGDQSVLYFL